MGASNLTSEAFYDSCCFDYARFDVYVVQWDRFLNVIKTRLHNCSFTLTRRELSLGDADATTGWYAETYSDTSIEGLLVQKEAIPRQMELGVYVKHDATLLTADPVVEGDQVKKNDDYYRVLTVTEQMIADSFDHRVCDLEKLSLWKV
jgi:hypothetical protein